MPTGTNPITRATEYRGELGEFLSKYHYQPDLTQRLDKIRSTPLSQHLINEIVLWKANRYVAMSDDLLQSLDGVSNLKTGEHRQAESLLKQLLSTHGVDVPLASTMLRFRNPQVFQIIDRHAYRAIYGERYALHTTTPVMRKVTVYFNYLDELYKLCGARGIVFETVDRLLYVFDKQKNGPLTARSNRGGA